MFIRDVVVSGKIVVVNVLKVYSFECGFVDLKVKVGDSVEVNEVIVIVISFELINELK